MRAAWTMALMAGIAAWAVPAPASLPVSCGAAAGQIVDRGLRRVWVVKRDCAHPEWPPQLVEVPWKQRAAQPQARPLSPAGHRARAGAGRSRIVVRPGMTVTLCWQSREAQGRLSAIALDAGSVGDRIRVKAGLHAAILRGIVRAPGQVELRTEASE